MMTGSTIFISRPELDLCFFDGLFVTKLVLSALVLESPVSSKLVFERI